MKKWIIGFVALMLIACGQNNSSGLGSGNIYTGGSKWAGDFNITNSQFLEAYGLCGNARSNIKRDAILYGTLGLLSGNNNWRNYLNGGLGILWNRAVVQNCQRINKVTVVLYSKQPFLPNGESTLYLELQQITRWNYGYGSNRYNDYQTLDDYIKAGRSKSDSENNRVPRLIFHQTSDENTTKATVNAFLWTQSPDTPARVSAINRQLEITTWRVSPDSTLDRDIGIEIKRNGSVIGESTLSFSRDNNLSKVSSKNKRQVASFLNNLKNHSLLLSLASALMLLLITALFLILRKEKIQE